MRTIAFPSPVRLWGAGGRRRPSGGSSSGSNRRLTKTCSTRFPDRRPLLPWNNLTAPSLSNCTITFNVALCVKAVEPDVAVPVTVSAAVGFTIPGELVFTQGTGHRGAYANQATNFAPRLSVD